MKVVRIDWIDSCASNLNWAFPEDFKSNVEPITITTYGVVFQETDKVITVAQNYGYNPVQVCSLMTIPKGCIQSIKEIDPQRFVSHRLPAVRTKSTIKTQE